MPLAFLRFSKADLNQTLGRSYDNEPSEICERPPVFLALCPSPGIVEGFFVGLGENWRATASEAGQSVPNALEGLSF
jgi:hypothetical protein